MEDLFLETGAVVRGPIKRVDRALQKVVRKYYRDPRCLTDIVRSCLVLPSVHSLMICLEILLNKSVIGHRGPDQGETDTLLMEMGEARSDKIFKMIKLKNRLTGHVKDGYRDICVNVEVRSSNHASSAHLSSAHRLNTFYLAGCLDVCQRSRRKLAVFVRL